MIPEEMPGNMIRIVIAVVVICAAIGLGRIWYDLSHPATDIRGCVTMQQTPMGSKLTAYEPRSKLYWTDKCPSGIGWSKAP